MNGVFEALGEPARRLLLELLSAGEQPAGALVAALQSRMPISQPAVSQHLKVLRDARPRRRACRPPALPGLMVPDAGTAAPGPAMTKEGTWPTRQCQRKSSRRR